MTTHDYRYCGRCAKEFRLWGVELVEPVYCPACEAVEDAKAIVRQPVYRIEVHAT